MKEELKKLVENTKELDKKVVIIFISVGVLQTISYYYTSRRFFRNNFYYTIFSGDELVKLWEYLYWFLGDFFTFFLLPVLIILFLLKNKLPDYGVRFGDIKFGLKLSAIFLVFMIPLLWMVSSTPAFAAKYPHLEQAKFNWSILLVYEMGMFAYMFAWEFIWRGFMLFGLKEKFGYYAIFMQMIPFVILHNGKPDIETFSAILGGIALGILAFRTRSFIYGVIVHFGIMFGIDLISSLRHRAGDFGLGFDSFLNVVLQVFK